MKSLITLLIFISAILLLIGCNESEISEIDGNYYKQHPSPIFNRSLTNEEMTISSKLNHPNPKSERSIQVNFPAPKAKPKIQWSRNVKYVRSTQITVDTKGGTWFYCWNSFQKGDIYYQGNDDLGMDDEFQLYLIRLNPDGSLSCKKKYDYFEDSEYFLTAVCEGALISMVKTYNFAPTSTNEATTVPEYYRAYFNELIGYIPKHDLSLECVDLQGNTVWRTNPSRVDDDNYFLPSVWRISGNRIMIPTGDQKSRKFKIYSLSNGSDLGSFQFPEWAIENGYLTTEQIKLPDNTEILPAPGETQIFMETSFWTPRRWILCKVIYIDGSILTSDGTSLYLSDKTGKKIWSLTLEDLGVKDKSACVRGNIHPAPDGRIVFFLDNDNRKNLLGEWDSIISLKSGNS